MSSTILSKIPDANSALTIQDSTLDAKRATIRATIIALAAGIFAALIVGGAIAAYGAIHFDQTGVEPLKFAAKIISENPLLYSTSYAVGFVVLGTALACALYRKKPEPSIGSTTATASASQTSTTTSSVSTTPASGIASTPSISSASITQPIVTTAVGVTSSDANSVLSPVPPSTESNVTSSNVTNSNVTNSNVISSSASSTNASTKPSLTFQQGRQKGLEKGKLLANALNALLNQGNVSVARSLVASNVTPITSDLESGTTADS